MKNGRGGSSIVSVYTVSPLKGLPVCWGRPQTVDHCRDHYLFTTSPKYKIKELFRAPYYGQIIQNAVALTLGQCEKLWQIQTSEVLGYLTECALNAKSIALNSKTWVNLLVRKVGIELLEAYQLLEYQKICGRHLHPAPDRAASRSSISNVAFFGAMTQLRGTPLTQRRLFWLEEFLFSSEALNFRVPLS